MKTKILNFLKSNYKILIIISLILLLFIFKQCSNISFNRNKIVLERTELENIKTQIIDSITTKSLKDLMILQDSIQLESEKNIEKSLIKIDSLKIVVNSYKKNDKKLKNKITELQDLYNDSINNPCKEILNAYEDRVDNLLLENGALTEEVFELALVYEQDSIGWEACKTNNILKDSLIQIKEDRILVQENINIALRRELKKNNNFFKKNGTWIGAGVGFFLGILVLK